MSAIAPSGNPQTTSGVGGADAALQPTSAQMLPQQIGLPSGPPAGAYTDAQYLAAEAQLRDQITNQYNTYLQQLGYTDPVTGQYIPGSITSGAQQAEDAARGGIQQADIAATQNAQQNGILFSGMRGQLQAQAEAPYWQQIGQTELQTPQSLATAYSQAADLVNQYNTQNNQLLADAATRATQTIQQNPPSTPPPTTPTTPTPPAGGSTTPPPSDVSSGGVTPGTAVAQPEVWYSSPGTPYMMMAAGGEVSTPTPAVLGDQGSEVVIPRNNLDDVGNAALDRVAAAAGVPTQSNMMMGGNPPRAPQPPQLPEQGIHWFGPGGSGVAYPEPTPSIPVDVSHGFRAPVPPTSIPVDVSHGFRAPGAPVSLPMLPAVNPARYLWNNYGLHSPIAREEAINMFLANHPGVASGRIGVGNLGHGFGEAIQDRLAAMRQPIHVPIASFPPIHGVPIPGITPA